MKGLGSQPKPGLVWELVALEKVSICGGQTEFRAFAVNYGMEVKLQQDRILQIQC